MVVILGAVVVVMVMVKVALSVVAMVKVMIVVVGVSGGRWCFVGSDSLRVTPCCCCLALLPCTCDYRVSTCGYTVVT